MRRIVPTLIALIVALAVATGSRADTIGKATVGSVVTNAPGDYKWGDRYALPVDGTFSKVSAYLADNGSVSGGQQFRAAIYADAGGAPAARKAVSSVVAVTDGRAPGWVDFPLSVTLPAGNYWLVLQGGLPKQGARRYADTSAGAERWNADAFSDGASDPFGTPSLGDWAWSLTATYTPTSPPPPPPPPPPPGGEINVLTQYGTSATAVANAINAANSQRVNLYFPAANYTSSAVKTLNSIQARGDGASSVITNTNKAQMAWRLTGTGAAIRNLKTTCPQCELPSGPPTSARLGTGESTGVFVDHATTATVSGVTVERAGSAGILTWHSSGVTVSGNTVRNTLADGIHTTGCSFNVTVSGNTVFNAGDDFFAVVSYTADGCRTHDVTISNNNGDLQPWGRGATVIGGYNVTISSNTISRTYGAGIHLASGGCCFDVDNVKINSNTLRNVAQVIHGVNILLVEGGTTYGISNATGSGNSRDTSKPCVRYDPSQAAMPGSSITCADQPAPVPAQPTFPIRGAFTYPWYVVPWTAHYTPEDGYYLTAQHIDQEIDDLVYAHLDVGISSWYGAGNARDTNLKSTLARTVARGSKVKWAIYYEREGYEEPTASQIANDLAYVRDNLASSPAYLRVGGRFVVFVYNISDVFDYDGRTAAAKALIDRWKSANAMLGNPAYLNMKQYDYYQVTPSQPDSWHEYFPLVPTTSSVGTGNQHFEIAPGYWRPNEPSPILARDLGRWQRNISEMLASKAAWQLVISYNEWYEASSVEAGGFWGRTYLDALHNLIPARS